MDEEQLTGPLPRLAPAYPMKQVPRQATPQHQGMSAALSSTPETAACTIVSKNYLAYARTLARSFHQWHPDIPFFVLLADEVHGYFAPGEEPFALVELSALAIPDLPRFCFQYTVIELNTAVKPYFLEYLFGTYQFSRLIYFDPDILVLENLSDLLARLDSCSIVLTPHLTAPLPDDGCFPDELAILRAGTYNLGFLALADSPTTQHLLRWWQDRLLRHCRMATEDGMHVDQKWLDFVPTFYDDVLILRDPGYNVAYWNLPHREVHTEGGKLLVNGNPCRFFHFSGIDPDAPSVVSKHDNRLTMTTIGPVAGLIKRYIALLLTNGYRETRRWPYAFGQFDNGVKIPDQARRLYLDIGEQVLQFGNPFSTTGIARSFLDWLNEDISAPPNQARPITRLWYTIYESRPDVVRAYPDLFGADREPFLTWEERSGLVEYDIPQRYIRHRELPTAKPPVRHGKKALGVNLVGHIASEKGVGEVARSLIGCLRAQNIPFVLNNVVDDGSANIDSRFTEFSEKNPHPVNVLALTAEMIPLFVNLKGPRYFTQRRTVAHSAWELADFPLEMLHGLHHLDELWVASDFIRDSLADLSPVPVVTIPYSLPDPLPRALDHQPRLGLPPDRFVFLCFFDFSSVFERKNPLGAIQAFKSAFTAHDDVLLIVKCINSRHFPAEFAALQEAADIPNIRITDAVISRAQVEELLRRSDCLVSLHRAEGFGLTLAEAMLLERPVIATGYSGNMDFMNAGNSFPCRYRLIPIDRDQGPYRKGYVWADPDREHAADLMRFVYENRDIAAIVGRQGRQDCLARLSPAVVGERVRERLAALLR